MRFGRMMLATILVFGGAATGHAAPPSSADRAALERLAADNDDAWTRKDWSRITSQYSRAGTLRVAPDARIEIGRDSIESFFRASFDRRPAGLRHVTRIDNIEMVTPDLAVADGYVRVERAEAGGGWALVREFVNSSLVVRESGRWKIHSVRATPLLKGGTER